MAEVERDIRIEPAVRADVPAIMELQRLAYQSEAELYQDWSIPPLVESLEQMAAEFERQVFLKAVLKHSGRIIGSVRGRLEGGTGLIGRLVVHPAFQRQGIGSALLRAIEGCLPQAQRLELFTGRRSRGNLLLYERAGFVPFQEKQLSERVALVFLRKTAIRVPPKEGAAD